MVVEPKDVRRYITSDGRVPFAEWFDALRDPKTKSIIDKRLNRVSLGNLGDYRSVGEGVYELKIDFGPGYRIYFGQIGKIIVLILCGGDKSTQDQDIRKSIEYLQDYRRRENANQ
ncbi:MAG: type II toxin-antitoxin system RelE/ParE family toxin [Nodularia sp. (in: Bacteria)]|nr:MAG: type II toxin-antitoxin system RelE/ParE family toxin [Nodularia sp. (in: cyanobacteria)]